MGTPAKIRLLVIDTNVVVSALLFPGEASRLVPFWKKGVINWLVTGEILQEYARVLAYPKFRLSPREIRGLIERQILPHIASIVPAAIPSIIKSDPADDKFLACALAGHADAIVSGDRHLLDLKTFRKIPILTLRQALDDLGQA